MDYRGFAVVANNDQNLPGRNIRVMVQESPGSRWYKDVGLTDGSKASDKEILDIVKGYVDAPWQPWNQVVEEVEPTEYDGRYSL